MDRLDVEIQLQRPQQGPAAATGQVSHSPAPSAAQQKTLDCEPLRVKVPRLQVEDLGWQQLPKQPPGDGAPSDLQITADLGALSEQSLTAAARL